MLEKLYAHGFNWQLALFMLLFYFIMRVKYVGNLFKSINTLFHESGHAIAALITHGEIYHIKLNANTSGEALTSSKGWFAKILISISGYLFPLMVCFIIVGIDRYSSLKYSNYFILTLSLTASIMWIRNSFGYIWSLSYVALALIPILYHNNSVLKFWLMLNLSCIMVENITATVYLLKLSIKTPKQAGDAAALQQATYLPAVIWSSLFLMVSILGLIIILFMEHTLKFKIYSPLI
jgi:hypothetical protein